VAKKEMTAEQVFQKVLATAMEQMGEPSTNKKKKSGIRRFYVHLIVTLSDAESIRAI
jgi:hypothetical protein